MSFKKVRLSAVYVWIALYLAHVRGFHSPRRSGYIGCLFSGSLCNAAEECFDDHLFGTCQLRDVLPDDYEYSLSKLQLHHLSTFLEQLVSAGYTWHDAYTQCMLSRLLFTYRHGSQNAHRKPICDEEIPAAAGNALESAAAVEVLDFPRTSGLGFPPPAASRHPTRFDDLPSEINISRSGGGGKGSTGLMKFDRRSYEEFIRYMSSLSADDLYALKQYLVKEGLQNGDSSADVMNYKGGPFIPPLNENARKAHLSANVLETSTDTSRSALSTEDLKSRSQVTEVDQLTASFDHSTDEPSHKTNNPEVSFQSMTASQRRVQILLYVLLGVVVIFVIVCIITCYQFCRLYRGGSKWWWKGFVDDELATDEYQDLCRQHMTSTMAEKRRVTFQDVDQLADDPATSSTCLGGMPALKEEPVKSGIDISTGTLVLSYMEEYLKNADRIQQEWDELSKSALEVDLGSFATVAFDSANARKNRCADILPYEKSRVLLNAENNASGSSYINASFIMDDDPRRPLYIVTQGPLPNTVDEFWQMVWEQGSVVIVNLTCLYEGSVAMCQRYWPETGRDLYHVYELSLLSEHDCCNDYIVRNFSMRNTATNEVRSVTQFHFLSWPSALPAVPESSPAALLEFRRRVNKSFRGRAPIIVHCSDGVGRTGTYCLLDVVLNRLAKGVKEINIMATLDHLRDQRFNMVHTREQFEFTLTAVAHEIHSMLFPPK